MRKKLSVLLLILALIMNQAAQGYNTQTCGSAGEV